MTNKLNELSKPVQIFKHPTGRNFWAVMADSTAGQNGVEPFYSQEYVSALLAELEANIQTFHLLTNDSALSEAKLEEANKRIATLEALLDKSVRDLQMAGERIEKVEKRLATPVRLPEGLAQKIKVTGYYEALNEMMDCVRAAGFKCVGDE